MVHTPLKTPGMIPQCFNEHVKTCTRHMQKVSLTVETEALLVWHTPPTYGTIQWILQALFQSLKYLRRAAHNLRCLKVLASILCSSQ